VKDSMKKSFLVFSVLLLLLPLMAASPIMAASPTKSLVIDVAGDTYVVADLNDPGDAYGFREKNYGSLDFVKTWYLWNVVEEEGEEVEKEKVVSIIYLKFDLSPIKNKTIESATLQLYARNVVLTNPRFVQVFLVSSDWSETTINFNSCPAWGTTAIASSVVYSADYWYSWDVTGDVISEGQAGEISFAVMLRDMDKGSEELVAFSSREAGANVPRLVVTYTESGVAWYWWVIGGVVLLALIAAAFLGGLRVRRSRQPS
jgi:hypothetical protein